VHRACSLAFLTAWGRWGSELHEVWRASPRLKAVRLLARSSRPLAVCLALDVVFQAVFPILVLLALGSMVSAIPGAIDGGWSSPAATARHVTRTGRAGVLRASVTTAVPRLAGRGDQGPAHVRDADPADDSRVAADRPSHIWRIRPFSDSRGTGERHL